MLMHQLPAQLRSLRLNAMAGCLEEQMNMADIGSYSFDDRLGMMVDREVIARENRLLVRRIRKAGLRTNACMEDIDYRAGRGLDRSMMMSLASCRWVHDHRGLMITGPTGAGKTWIACALAHKACLEGYTARYRRLPNLLRDLDAARELGTFDKVMTEMARTDLIVLDDWGLERMNQRQGLSLLEVLEDRYDVRSTIVVSQIPPEKLHDTFKDPTIADAALDRVIHNSYRIDLKGDSMRKRDSVLTEAEAKVKD